jgi:hypothetical protein
MVEQGGRHRTDFAVFDDDHLGDAVVEERVDALNEKFVGVVVNDDRYDVVFYVAHRRPS